MISDKAKLIEPNNEHWWLLLYLTVVIAASILLSSCSKQEYPKQMVNFKATDCIYEINNDVINFTYVANTCETESYKRKVLSGFCGVNDTISTGDNYLYLRKATITSCGFAYMQ